MNLIPLLSILLCVHTAESSNDSLQEAPHCGGDFPGRLSIIRSPPESGELSCVYVLRAPEQCALRYHFEFVEFSLPDSVGCVGDRLEVDQQSVLCGDQTGSREFFASKGVLRLRYVSSGAKGSGFKILVRRSECATEETTESLQETSTQLYTDPPSPLIPYNTPTGAKTPPQCCQTEYNSRRFLLTSPNFPNSLETNTECTYTIQKAADNICRLRLNFLYFSMGLSPQNACPQGYLKVDGKLICGCNENLRLTTLLEATNGKVITFKSLGGYNEAPSGFVLEVIQEECPKKYYPEAGGRLRSLRAFSVQKLRLMSERSEAVAEPRVVKTFYYFAEPQPVVQEVEMTGYVDTESVEAVVTSHDRFRCLAWSQNQIRLLIGEFGELSRICRKTESDSDGETAERNDCVLLNSLGGYFQSPGYPYYYPRNLNVCYRFQKQPGYCGTRIFMVDFQLEYSRGCYKDFVTSENDQRYCGGDLKEHTWTFDLTNKNHQDLSFVTDSFFSCRGFYGVYQQKACQTTYPEIPATVPPPLSCDRIIQEKTFRIEVSGNDRKCAYQIRKFSEGVCKMSLYFEIFDLECTVESLVVDGMMFCGRLSGKRVLLEFEENEMYKEIEYRSRLGGSYNELKFRVIGEQITEDCSYPEVPLQRLIQLTPSMFQEA